MSAPTPDDHARQLLIDMAEHLSKLHDALEYDDEHPALARASALLLTRYHKMYGDVPPWCLICGKRKPVAGCRRGACPEEKS